MANATSVTSRQGRSQFQGVFSEMWQVKATIDADSLNDGAGDNDTVTVPGVALGDHVISVGFGVDLAGVMVHGYVSAANTVTLRFQNESGGTVDLGSTNVKIVIGRPAF